MHHNQQLRRALNQATQAVPPSLQVGAAYGLTVKRDAPPAAAAFAQALLQPPAQAVFARYGFGAP